jgi:hypothetical protein
LCVLGFRYRGGVLRFYILVRFPGIF